MSNKLRIKNFSQWVECVSRDRLLTWHGNGTIVGVAKAMYSSEDIAIKTLILTKLQFKKQVLQMPE